METAIHVRPRVFCFTFHFTSAISISPSLVIVLSLTLVLLNDDMARSILQGSSRLTWRSSCMSRAQLAPRIGAPCARAFASKPVFEEKHMVGLKVNGTRMMDTLHATCDFGKAHPYGSGYVALQRVRSTENNTNCIAVAQQRRAWRVSL